MKILLLYLAATPKLAEQYKDIARTAPKDVSITTCNIALPGKHQRANWEQLNNLWKSKDQGLLSLYNQVIELASKNDILINYNGWNLHPKLLEHLNTYNIYSFYDDPESSNKQSKHIAPHYDATLCGNISSQSQYKAWGCEKVAWIPISLIPLAEQTIAPEMIEQSYRSKRTNDLILCCGHNPWRTQRLSQLKAAFPDAKYFGHGWDSGWVDQQQLNALYLNTKIGWNIHNSTGPINHRLYSLPAYGILQIADNKYPLGKIYQLDKEVIGFNTIEEAIQLTRYYLKNPDEAQKIAVAGYQRYQKDYTPAAVWQRLIKQIKQWTDDTVHAQIQAPRLITTNKFQKFISPAAYQIRKTISKIKATTKPQKWSIQETIYLDNPTHQRSDFQNRHMPKHAVATADDPNHQEAVCCAITHLIDDATNLSLPETTHPHLLELLDLAPKIRINTGQRPELYIHQPAIILNADCVSNLQSILSQTLAIPRLLLNTYHFKMSTAYLEMLKKNYAHVRHYTLSDPYVPLLTPIAADVKTRHRILHCF